MAYIVKEIATATELNPTYPEGERHIYYNGKADSFATDIKHFTDYHFCEGWKSRRFAEQFIKKEQNYYNEHDNGMWDYDWEIIAI